MLKRIISTALAVMMISVNVYAQDSYSLSADTTAVETDNSMWGLYFVSKTDTTYKVADWRNMGMQYNDKNVVYVKNNNPYYMFHSALPFGWFKFRPTEDTAPVVPDSRGQGAITWTAPKSGTYTFRFEARDIGIIYSGTTIITNAAGTDHHLVRVATDATPAEVIKSLHVPGSRSGTTVSFEETVSVEAGETIALVSKTGAANGYGETLLMNYVITNETDPTEVYDASKMGKSHFANSPLSIYQLNSSKTATSDMYKLNLASTDNGWTATKSGDSVHSAELNGDEVTFKVSSSEAITTGFMVPEDGYWKINVNLENTSANDAGVNAYQINETHLHAFQHSLNDSTLTESISIPASSAKDHSFVVEAKAYDQIFLKAYGAVASVSVLQGDYTITKVDKIKFYNALNYGTSEEAQITSLNELSSGQVLTSEMSYIAEPGEADNFTVVMVAFGEDGNMTSASASDTVAYSKLETTITTQLTIPEDCAMIKTFVVDTLNNLWLYDGAQNIIK